MKQVLAVVLISAGTSAATLWGYNSFIRNEAYVYPNKANTEQVKTPANYAGFNGVTGDNSCRLYTSSRCCYSRDGSYKNKD